MQNTPARRPSPGKQRIHRIGHRGAAGHAPENTLAAIHKGISLGADWIELDVQSTRDGHLVILHDTRVDRTTNETGLVSDLTCKELQLLDAGNGERILTLEQALAAVSGRAGIMLEGKPPGVGPAMHRAVQALAYSGPVIYASFQHGDIEEIHWLNPFARTLALVESIPASGTVFARNARAAMVGLSIDCATPESIAALHGDALDVWVYTVNDPQLIHRTIELGADGIISDFPDRVPKLRST